MVGGLFGLICFWAGDCFVACLFVVVIGYFGILGCVVLIVLIIVISGFCFVCG